MRRVAAITLSGTVLLGGWLWWVLLSPWAFQPHGAPEAMEPTRVFAYGTLRHALVRRVITGEANAAEPAVLPGWSRRGLDIRPAPGANTPGVVFEAEGEALRRLDRYERVGLRYERISLPLADGEPAWVYRRLRSAGEVPLER